MKIKNLLQFVFILLAGQLLFSCNSAKYYEFSAGKQAPYKIAKEKKAPELPAATLSISEIALEAATEKAEAKTVAPILEANAEIAVAAPAKAAVTAEKAVSPKSKITEAEALSIAKEHVKNMTKAEKKVLKKEIKEAMRQGGSRVSIVEVILAILVPPLAVFLHDGIGTSFWISIILWLLGILPGIIYALLVVTDTI